MSGKEKDFSDLFAQAYYARIAALDPALKKYPRLFFAIAYHRNIYAKPMEFHDKPYLMDIYRDDAHEIVLKSSVQTGKSEFLIISAHSWAERGLQVLYCLPTIDIRNLFVANRVDRLYKEVPHYYESVRGTDQRGLKQFGDKNGSIFFLGSNSSTTFIEKPIDLIIGDETDRFDQANYEKAPDRMTASPYKLWYEASNPTVDNYGIDFRWRKSDQREWFVKCQSCNKWQALDWFRNIVEPTDDNSYQLIDTEWQPGMTREPNIFCIRCGSPLNRYDIRGCWVARHPSRDKTHGYHIHQLLSSFVLISSMWEKFLDGLQSDIKMQVFYNSQLGLTYSGKGSKITDSILNACKDDYFMPVQADGCFMGVDVGKVLHVVIWQLVHGGRMRLVFAGTVKEFEDLDYLFARFNIISYCLDAMPETRKSMEYAKKHIGRGWVCRYHNGLTEIKKDEEERVLSADRTMIMDRVMSWFVGRNFILPQNAHTLDKGDFYSMLTTPTRFFEEEKQQYSWQGDPDHYFHAIVYSLLAYIARGDFATLSVDIHSPLSSARPQMDPDKLPKNFEQAVPGALFPPGTPEHLIKHYQNLFKEMQDRVAASKIVKE